MQLIGPDMSKRKINYYDFLILGTLWVLNDTVTGSFEYPQHRFLSRKKKITLECGSMTSDLFVSKNILGKMAILSVKG